MLISAAEEMNPFRRCTMEDAHVFHPRGFFSDPSMEQDMLENVFERANLVFVISPKGKVRGDLFYDESCTECCVWNQSSR